MPIYQIHVLEAVQKFIATLSCKDQAKIRAALEMLARGHFTILYIKTIRTPIKELIIKQYRFIFYVQKQSVFLIGGFIKKTNKTPLKEIENAYTIYKAITQL